MTDQQCVTKATVTVDGTYKADLHSGLPNHDLLEAPLKGSVLLHVLPVLCQRGGPNAAQLPSRQHGL